MLSNQLTHPLSSSSLSDGDRGRGEVGGRAGGFHGRERELGVLVGGFEGVMRRGEAGVVAVRGHGGMG